MPINLQELNEKTLDFLWLDGSEIHCPMPPVRFVNKVNRAENTFEKANELTVEFLNTNKEKRVFTAEEVSELNSTQITAILGAVIGIIQEVDEHPNS